MYPYLDGMKKGEVGGSVKTKRGYFLFRLLERTESYQKSWDQVKRDVNHLVPQERKERAVSEWRRSRGRG